jgi:hypothetical protein
MDEAVKSSPTLRVKAKEPQNYFDLGFSLSRSGAKGATEVEEREQTADADGVVGDGAVADSTVVVGGASVEDGSGVECPNTLERRLVNFPIMDTTLCCSQSPTACPLSNQLQIPRRQGGKGCHSWREEVVAFPSLRCAFHRSKRCADGPITQSVHKPDSRSSRT